MDIDLGRGQANARRFIHGFGHVRRELANAIVHPRNALGFLVQARIGIAKNLKQGHERVQREMRERSYFS